jgi:hypothetical protein
MENPFNTMTENLAELKTMLEGIIADLNKGKSNGTNQKEWGDIHFASLITGYALQTIYIKSGKGEIPHIKRDGKLWFERLALLKWIETGIIDRLDKKD